MALPKRPKSPSLVALLSCFADHRRPTAPSPTKSDDEREEGAVLPLSPLPLSPLPLRFAKFREEAPKVAPRQRLELERVVEGCLVGVVEACGDAAHVIRHRGEAVAVVRELEPVLGPDLPDVQLPAPRPAPEPVDVRDLQVSRTRRRRRRRRRRRWW